MFERTCTNYKLPVVPRTPEAREAELAEVEILRQAEGLTPKEEDYVTKRRLTPKEEEAAYADAVWRDVDTTTKRRALASAQKALDKDPSIAKMPFRLVKSFFEMIREVGRG